MKIINEQQDKHRVYLECSETTKRIKAIILTKNERELEVETPTGYILHLQKKTRRGQYSIRIGMVEFHSDGKLVN
jgi:plasmid maintenance system killer protein